MYLAKNKIIVPKEWLHNSEIKNNKDMTVAM